MLDEKRTVRAHEACVPPQLSYRAAFRHKDSFGISSVPELARDSGLLWIDKKERVLDSDGEEGELDGLLTANRKGSAFGDFSNFDGLKRFVGVKNQTDVVAGIPTVALLDFLEKSLRAFLKNLGIFLIGAFLANMA